MRSRSIVPTLLVLAACAFPDGAQAQRRGAKADEEKPLSAYLDSAAVVRALAALPAAEIPEGVSPLFTLEFDTAGGVDRSEGLFPQLPAAFTGPVSAILRAHARRQAPDADPDGLFLRAVTGPGASIALTDGKLTPPELLNGPQLVALLQPVGRRLEAERRDRGAQVHVRARVLADGTVDSTSVWIVESTADAEADRRTMAAALQMRFRPAMLEGLPTTSRVVAPFVLYVAPEIEPEYTIELVESVSDDAPFATLVDSAALAGALYALPAGRDPAGVQLRVRLDTAGAVAGVEAVHARTPAAQARALAAALRPHVRPQPPSPQPRDFIVRVVPGPGARADRSGFGEMRPSVENQGMVRQVIRDLGRRNGGRLRQDVLVAVDANGRADLSSIQFMGRPDEALASDLAGVVELMRFRRGTVAGQPARMWVRIAFRVGRP